MDLMKIMKKNINTIYAKFIANDNTEEIEYLPIFYVAGSQTLPPPLSPEEEEECIKKLSEENNLEARQTLVERNLRLVVYIAKKFENTGIGIEDLISIGTIGLMKAINTFNTNKNIKLATYASRCIENEILMFLRKTANTKSDISIDEPLNVDWDGNELLLSDVLSTASDTVSTGIESEDEIRILMKCIAELSDRERQIICMRFGLCGCREYTQKEVADTMGISQSYISRIEKKIICNLKDAINKETSTV